MADNVTAEAVVTPGSTFATDDEAGVQHPYCKLEWGPNNTYTKVDVGANAVPIQDGGNSITVDGSFYQATQPISVASLPLPSGAATLAGQTQPGVDIGDVTVNNASGASAVNVQDGGNSLTVDGTVTANAGTNLNTSALALEAGGNLAATAASLAVLDNIVAGSEAQVDIVASLPAGDNNIGNVDVVTLPALPAGTNFIGYIGHGKTIKTVSGSLTADTDVIALVSAKRLKVIAYSLVSVGVNANTVIFKSNGTGGTELWRLLMQSSTAIAAGANLAIAAPSFLFATVAGEKLTIDVNQTDTIHYSISYFDDDAT